MSLSASSTVVSFVFVGLMCAAIWSDATTRRLPNRLTVTAVLVGLVARLTLGPEGVIAGSMGILAGIGLATPLFLLGAIGGGDVKLMAAAGAFLGPGQLLWALLIAASLGLLLVVEEIVRRGVAIPVLYRAKDLLLYFATLGRRGQLPASEGPGVVAVPYGVAIAAGAVAAWFIPSAMVLR
jgi:prepilin peptidase CpaA